MSAISSYAKALAVAAGRAIPIATRRHVHLSDRPLVLVPLALAGEANAPLAAMIGTDQHNPALLVVPQPRNRDLRFDFAASLADVVLAYVRSCTARFEVVGANKVFLDAPQLLVPNAAGLGFVKLLGRSTRFRRTHGPFPVAHGVPLLGRWLTYLGERSEHPGSSTMLAMTQALNLHWASGQSAVEDANLAALLGWIDPPEGVSGPEAALAAEDPLVWPPAGPSTDPAFDNEVLAPAIRAYESAAPDSPKRLRAVETLERELRGQLEPTWRLMWRAIEVLRQLPAAATVETRWAADRRDFSRYHDYLTTDGRPQARRDGAVAAARRLQSLEREQTTYDASRALDDPLVMASYRVNGEAFQGTVVSVDRDRRILSEKGRRVTRPLIVVSTGDPVHLPVGKALRAPERMKQNARITEIARSADGVLVSLELDGGMGRAAAPAPGSVPEVGHEITYTSVYPDAIRAPDLPPTDQTPWTHGGPPRPYVPTDDDAQEAWE
ncbi:hypothetical protein GA0070624_3250 [Micromonospora rhizosphaerae]|uniref:Uncharacterized protein n=1 Tax=Micromonospora rhizosphaerae TaxID=568872 RepID=A0A1C6S9M3_9ACTN|nr:hypothetical protein [Micromonospora rhizosphaerae]SCL26159.1 hypothetical protein GA0070624_3250 [Micromonospora rhizosphaerae]